MKRIILLIACVLAATYYLQAQNVPQGMNYQAVARNLKGQMLQNQGIALKISLRADGPAGKIVYAEIHEVVTNDLGLFNLIIGQGRAAKKVGLPFVEVPWGEAEIWIEIGLDEQGGENFEMLNVSKLMSVPYAFHAGTADKIKDRSFEEWYTELEEQGKRRGGSTGIPFWTVWGNSNVDTNYHWMGTSVAQDVIFKGNNIEAIRIKTDGSVNISGRSSFGDDLFVRRNLTVGQNTTLRGLLDVDLATTLKDDLTVKKNTALEGTLDVDLATTLKDDLTVKKNTALEGTLDVDLATTLKDSLVVEGETILKDKLSISDDVNGFVFSVENTSGDEAIGGDGIEIKLGRTHPAWDGSAYINVTNPVAEVYQGSIDQVRGWVEGEEFEFTDLTNFIPAAYIAGTVCRLADGLYQEVAGPINEFAGLPIEIPETDILLDLLKEINGPDMSGEGSCDTPGDCLVPDELINPELADGEHYVGGKLVLPGFSLGLPESLPCDGLPSFSAPNINFVDVDGSLTIANQFVSFFDKDNRELGSIRALSVTDWGDYYFDGVRFVSFIGSGGKIDPLGAITGLIREFTEIADSYNTIGVEYASGHGDYAEWLERVNPHEVISRGDIVAVKGGKITKNLEGAEQIMAVSEHPIVLGNMPPKDKVQQGNNVAFMGQIPVKVMGPVTSGDYIVAKGVIPGYGIAVHPADLMIEDTKFIVGRSWETREGKGPAMVNTVIGVHNGDYMKILKRFEKQFNESEARFEALETRVEVLAEKLMEKTENN
ncbi:MAG: hypothetical protein KTR30_38520 [Saprospiraceae bacterium]|nr:hypothetical protein [Saprospiraceae bacterium]